MFSPVSHGCFKASIAEYLSSGDGAASLRKKFIANLFINFIWIFLKKLFILIHIFWKHPRDLFKL